MQGCGRCTAPRRVKETTPVCAAVATGPPTHHPQEHRLHSCQKRQVRITKEQLSVCAAVATGPRLATCSVTVTRCTAQKHPTNEVFSPGIHRP